MNGHKIWIDLDNSPHVPFFAPIIEQLRSLGHELVLTSRDNAQVAGLLKLHGLDATQVGHHFGRNRLAKILRTLVRSLRLAVLMWRKKPDLAMSHGSRSQIIAAFLLRVPSLVIFDYEFTSSAGGIRATWSMTPEAVLTTTFDAPAKHSLHYPGIKEDVYVWRFRPDLSLRAQLGLKADDVVVTIRPPASEAHYHNPLSDRLLLRVIQYVSKEPHARIILLPRTKNQLTTLSEQWSQLIADRRILIPEHVVDGLNLIWNSDLVISGGGTMNREAAALGVPVYSIFRGKLGAVDKYLVSQERLVLIETEEDIDGKIKLVPRVAIAAPAATQRPALTAIMANISMILEA